MRLYSLAGAAAVDSGGVRYVPADDGGFDLPDELAAHLHSCHVGGKPAWETFAERHARLMAEELARRSDPAALLAAVEQLVRPAVTRPVPVSSPDPEPVPALPDGAPPDA